MHLQATVTVSPPFATVRLVGELDVASAGEVRGAVQEALDAGAATVVLDLADVTFIDCAGVSSLLWCRRRVGQAGGQLATDRLSLKVERVLRFTGADGELRTP